MAFLDLAFFLAILAVLCLVLVLRLSWIVSGFVSIAQLNTRGDGWLGRVVPNVAFAALFCLLLVLSW
ncbi:MAG: hypothetical protein HRU30_03070 [Rhodobacteraceae bacterium]|nr:hypothetical protein [Paracoccaceae bacterium]